MAEVTYLGHSCFRLRGREGIIVMDPYHRAIGYDLGRPTAHIVTVSHQHPDHNNTAAVKPLRESVFIIDGPGEYEVGGIFIHGIQTYHDKERGARLGRNTIYVVHLDGVVFCHLGDLGHELNTTQIEEIGNVDVLFVPVGDGEWTLSPPEAAEVISEIEPRLVIPMHYAMPQLQFDAPLVPLDRFIHEMGLTDWQPEEKLVINASSATESAETRVVILKPTNGQAVM
ncbi:MAG: Zn-dependent hydrolase [Herpetosiphonaceae bacterium]|nr:MAG: Zn-dependent hydrolase [Herpetosiphonaceae bacterium]